MKNIWRVKPIKIRFGFDTDRDGVKDRFDCQPFNPFKQHNDEEALCNQMGGFVRDDKCVVRSIYTDNIGMNCEEPPLMGKKITRYMTNDESMSSLGIKHTSEGANYVLCEFPIENILNIESNNRERVISCAKRRVRHREETRQWWRTATEEQKEELRTRHKEAYDLKPELKGKVK